jgi:hypothetical protein
MHRTLKPLLTAFAVVALAQFGVMAGEAQRTTPATLEQLSSDVRTYRQHVTTLANPYFEGRAPDTEGNRKAADYIEAHFRKYRLLPAFPENDATRPEMTPDWTAIPRVTYRQQFIHPASQRPGRSIKVIEQSVGFARAGEPMLSLGAGTDFNVLGYSGNATVTGPIAFVGYSVQNDNKDYDTYARVNGQDVDLTGKIAVMFRFEPMTAEGKSKWSEEGWSFSAGLEPKLRLAARKGAAAIILVNPPGAADERVNKLEDVGLMPQNGRSMDIPVVMLSIPAADNLLRAADPQGRGVEQFRDLANEKGEVIDLVAAPVTIHTKLERVPIITDNVGGILPGKGALANEYVVFGAHYDHVGYGYFGSRDMGGRGKIHPGADDNASGTSGLLLMAQKFSAEYATLGDDANARSILFLAFSGEESGLIGSRYYTKHMIAPADRHYVMINFDMIGRLREDKLEIGGVDTGVGLQAWTQPYWDASGLQIKATRIGASNSDHFSFHQSKIPNLFFFTGLHKEYHAPTDTYDLINVEGAVKIVDLGFRVGLDLAQRAEPLPFKTREASSESKSDEEKKDENPGPVMGQVRFGIMPGDYSGDVPGVLIGGVTEDLPAAKAGLKAGDLMVKWNDKEIKSVEEWMPLLSAHKPGDVVKITYVRDKEERTTEATLVARPARNRQ